MSSKISADWCVLWVVTIELVFGRLVEVEPVATDRYGRRGNFKGDEAIHGSLQKADRRKVKIL